MAEEKWYFTKEQLLDSPSRKCGIEPQQESKYRQQAADLIQNMGQSLMVSQLCINTAIVYMHRFYAFHSFTHFHRNHIAAASLFLAAKVEEQPRKLQSVIEAGHNCLFPKSGRIDINSEQFLEQTQDLIFNENILLQTLGFDVAIDHPHTHVVKTCHLVRAPKDLAQSSYFMASNSLHKTTMCLQYKPTVVACFCIHVACKWSNWQIPQSKEGKHWFEYVDTSVTTELLDRLTLEFLHYFDTNRSSDRTRSDLNQERDSRKALAAQEEAHHRQHSSSSRSVHQGHSSQSIPHPNSSQHRHGQHKMSSHNMGGPQTAPYAQHSSSNHHVPHGSTGQPHYNTQNTNQIPPVRDPHKKLDDKMKHHPDYVKTQNMNRPRIPSELMQSKNVHPRHKPEIHPVSNALMDRNKEMNEAYQTRVEPHGEQRSSNALNRVDPYRSDKDVKHRPNPAVDVKKRDFNNVSKSSNEFQTQNIQKPPPNYHEYKNQNNLASSVNKHNYPNDMQKTLLKPDIKPSVVNPLSITDELKTDILKTPPKPSIFSPDNKDINLFKKSKPDTRTPTNKKPISPSARKVETPKKVDGRVLEQTPSQQIIKNDKSRTNSAIRLTDTPGIPTAIPRPISPFISPLKKSNSSSRNRTRTSSSSDAELVPVVKKLEDISEFGNFFRDKSSMQNANDKLTIPSSTNNSIKVPEISSANGIETNPDLISSLLKESLLGLDNSISSSNSNTLQMTIAPIIPTNTNVPDIQLNTNDEYKHKSEKKKKKDKHKHKDKSKEERKKHKKDKERSKERQEVDNATQAIPIKITIPKDKIDMPEPSIKIKIPKERIKSLPRSDPGTIEHRTVQGLKIKIPKEAVESYPEANKKRERGLSADRGPPTKSTRTT